MRAAAPARRIAILGQHLCAAPVSGKRAIVREHSTSSPPEGLSAVQVETYEQPAADELRPKDVLIRVHAASVNFPDLLQPSNQHNIKPQLPFVLGAECAGEVVTVGAEAAGRFSVGDRVMHWPAALRGAQGGMQSWVRADAQNTYKIPGNLSFEEAACVPLAYMTAYTALIFRGKLQKGQSVLVLGATGGVGMAATQMAKAVGCNVIAAGGTDEKLRIVREEFGADHVVNYTTTPKFRDAVKAMTGGKGVDMVFDPVSGEVLMEALKCCNYGAKVLIVGFAGAPVSKGVTSVPTPQILAKNLTVLGSGPDLFRRSNMEAGMQAITSWISEGKLRPRVHAAFPIEQVRDALMQLSGRAVIGKVVVVPS